MERGFVFLIEAVPADPGHLAGGEHVGEAIRVAHAPDRLPRPNPAAQGERRQVESGHADQAGVGPVACGEDPGDGKDPPVLGHGSRLCLAHDPRVDGHHMERGGKDPWSHGEGGGTQHEAPFPGTRFLVAKPQRHGAVTERLRQFWRLQLAGCDGRERDTGSDGGDPFFDHAVVDQPPLLG